MMKTILEFANIPDKRVLANLDKEGDKALAEVFLTFLQSGLSVGAQPFLDDFANIVDEV